MSARSCQQAFSLLLLPLPFTHTKPQPSRQHRSPLCAPESHPFLALGRHTSCQSGAGAAHTPHHTGNQLLCLWALQAAVGKQHKKKKPTWVWRKEPKSKGLTGIGSRKSSAGLVHQDSTNRNAGRDEQGQRCPTTAGCSTEPYCCLQPRAAQWAHLREENPPPPLPIPVSTHTLRAGPSHCL